MGKKGPCCHCGVTSTPLWRNGPSEKPVLCNACGSRWRTKGSLVNYTPLHSRAAEPDDFEDYHHRASYKVKTITPVKKHKEANDLKRKFENNHVTDYGVANHSQYNNGGPHHHCKGLDEDTSNRSSSGSAISNSDSCAPYGTADASDLRGPTQQPNIWYSTTPSRKRTCITTNRKPSPVEMLTKDLYTIWHEQQSSCLSVSSEDDLLLMTYNPMGSVEFGHGSVLIRNPNSLTREEESEASSLPNDHKKNTLINSQQLSFLGQTGVTGGDSSIRGIEQIKKKPTDEGIDVFRTKRDTDQLEKLQILANHNSPLCLIDLQDIVNFDGFTSQLTNDEQQRLLKYLPHIDTMEAPQRLKSMFDSPQFKENLLYFQKLLAGGVFDSSLSGISRDNCRILKKLLLSTPTKSKWVEQYEAFKDVKGKTRIEESKFVGGFPTNYSATKKRPQNGQLQKLAGAKVGLKNPKRVPVKAAYDTKEQLDNDETFLRGKKAISLQNKNGSLLCDSYFSEEGSEQDLLIDLPSNSSFPQAELLLPTMSVGVQASTCCSSVYPNNIRH